MEVPVEVVAASSVPPLDLVRWDHVAEASLALPSGRLEIHECAGGSVDILPVPPGTYRVMIEHGGGDTTGEDGLDGRDRCPDVLWPAPCAEVTVLNRYVDPRSLS